MKIYSILTFLLLAGLNLGAAGGYETFERKISKSFPLNATGTVDITTKYGAVTYHSWDKAEVKMDVRMVVDARNRAKAEEVFDDMDVQMTSSGPQRVRGYVDFPGGRGVTITFFNWTSGESRDVKVYWDVYLPKTANVETEARYANVTLPDMDGNTTLSLRYGNLNTGNLTKQNDISVSYGNARTGNLGNDSEATIRYGKFDAEQLGDFRYDGRYSEFKVERAGVLEIEAGYEELTIGTAESVEIDGSYNDIEIESVGELDIDGNYSSIEIGTVRTAIDIEARYGDIEIDRVMAGFREIEIESGYINIEIDIDGDAGYTIDLYTRYADIDFDRMGELTDRKSIKEGNTESLQGTLTGKGNGRVKIESSYGDIEIE